VRDLLLLGLLDGWGPHHVVGNRRGQRCGRVQGLGLHLQVLGDALAVDVTPFRLVPPILEPYLHLRRRKIQLLGDYLALRSGQILFQPKAALQLQDLSLREKHPGLSFHPWLGGSIVAAMVTGAIYAVFTQLGSRGGHLAVVL